MNDFDISSSCGGYGIFDNIGIKNLNNITWDDDDDIKTRYKRLLETRNSDF